VNYYSSCFHHNLFAAGFRTMAIVLVLSLATFTVIPPAWSQDTTPAPNSEGGSTNSAMWGAAAGLSSLVYFPVKAVFALGGGIVGGLAYAFSGGNESAAKSIWTTSMYGTYFITPDHLRGDKPIRFLGVADEPASQATVPAPMEPIR
jgi:hypothetical protein